MYELHGSMTGRFKIKDGGLLIPHTKVSVNLLKEDYTIEDLFEMGQSSYELTLNDYMFVDSIDKKDCLLFFLCQAGNLNGTRIIDTDLRADEPFMSLVIPNYDFVLTIVCSSVDLQQQKAIIYCNVSDMPDEIKDVMLVETMQG